MELEAYIYSAIDIFEEINVDDGDELAHQVDDAGSGEPDGDEDGDELSKPVQDISHEKLAKFGFRTPWVSP